MKSASELLEAYLNNVATPKVSASQFAEDGVLELPWVKAYARGPAEVEKLLAGMLAKVPDFRFKNLIYFIRTPDKVAAEYHVEAQVLATGKMYRQTYAGVLHAENGKIKLLHETLTHLSGVRSLFQGLRYAARSTLESRISQRDVLSYFLHERTYKWGGAIELRFRMEITLRFLPCVDL